MRAAPTARRGLADLRRTLTRRRLWPKLEAAAGIAAIGLGATSYAVLAGRGAPAAGFSPPAITALLVATLVSIMVLMMLVARRLVALVASRRAGRAGARLHLKLVGMFAAAAAVPTLLMVGFAALLFQYGVQFYFSGRLQTVLVNADRVAQAYVAESATRLQANLPPMVGDLRGVAAKYGMESPEFQNYLVFQAQGRGINEAGVFLATPSGPRWLVTTQDARALGGRLTLADVERAVAGKPVVLPTRDGRVAGLIRLSPGLPLYVYASRGDPTVVAQAALSRSALTDYRRLVAKSRQLQFRFNLMLIAVSVLVLAAVIWAALRMATRLATPIGRLALAAERVGQGDYSARVGVSDAPEEIAGLARAFNRMTAQIGVQQRALVDAGEQIDARRRLTEAVLAGVSAGVLAVDAGGVVRMMNAGAATLLRVGDADATGVLLDAIAPELARLLDAGESRGEVAIARGADTQTLAVRIVRAGVGEGGAVVTFDDISAQLADQRRAAWADVARRIAHEIKNPLTPIQLSAERLQRKYAGQIAQDAETFGQLTGTIVRQVGDLRRMVDEFSAFARMPAPVFGAADLAEIAREALTLQELAYPGIAFTLAAGDVAPMVCDRSQLARALTNLVQNAAQSVAARQERSGDAGTVTVTLASSADGETLTMGVEDNGLGLPPEARHRLTEPYVTTRAKGTGLGLAIVKKIAEDHGAALELTDRPGGGARVAIRFHPALLARRALPMAAE